MDESARNARVLRSVSFLGAFESTLLPLHEVDVMETTDHEQRWLSDIDFDYRAGIRRFRYPLRWHRIEHVPGRYDWRATDAVLEHLRTCGAEVIVDILHHTSYPSWLTDGLRDPRFGPAFTDFAAAVATRYPWLRGYTVFNEPFATLFLAGHEALWPPYDRGIDGFVRLAANTLPAVAAATRSLRELLPEARHVWVDTCEHHAGTPGAPARHAALANDRRFVIIDLVTGHNLDHQRPFLAEVLRSGGERLFALEPVTVDVLGLDYYSHSEWWYDDRGATSPSPKPLGFAQLATQYAMRYGVPMLLAETNLRGLPSDRVSWLRIMLEQYQIAVAAGVPLEGFCWFPSVDSRDWDSLLARPGRRTDPVGVRTLRSDDSRQETMFTSVWKAAVRGAEVPDLPAFRFQPPHDEQLAGYVRGLSHWTWEDPPEAQAPPAIHIPHDGVTG